MYVYKDSLFTIDNWAVGIFHGVDTDKDFDYKGSLFADPLCSKVALVQNDGGD